MKYGGSGCVRMLLLEAAADVEEGRLKGAERRLAVSAHKTGSDEAQRAGLT